MAVFKLRVTEAAEVLPKPTYYGFKCCGVLGVFLTSVAFILLIIFLARDNVGGFDERDDSDVFNDYFHLHPLFMGFTFLLFLPMGIIAFEMFPYCCARSISKYVHAFWNTLAIAFSIAGFVVAVDFKNMADIDHFKTPHGCLGLFTLIILWFNWIAGMLLYLCCRSRAGTFTGHMKPYHKRGGIFSLVMSYITLCMGIMKFIDLGDYDDITNDLANAIVIIATAGLGCILCCVIKFIDKIDAAKTVTVVQKKVVNGHVHPTNNNNHNHVHHEDPAVRQGLKNNNNYKNDV